MGQSPRPIVRRASGFKRAGWSLSDARKISSVWRLRAGVPQATQMDFRSHHADSPHRPASVLAGSQHGRGCGVDDVRCWCCRAGSWLIRPAAGCQGQTPSGCRSVNPGPGTGLQRLRPFRANGATSARPDGGPGAGDPAICPAESKAKYLAIDSMPADLRDANRGSGARDGPLSACSACVPPGTESPVMLRPRSSCMHRTSRPQASVPCGAPAPKRPASMVSRASSSGTRPIAQAGRPRASKGRFHDPFMENSSWRGSRARRVLSNGSASRGTAARRARRWRARPG